jgi:hypothetical protein
MYSLNPAPSPPSGQDEGQTAFVINNVTGYQAEFYPPEFGEELNGAVCQVYGVESEQLSVGVLICLKQSGSDLLAGFSPSPSHIDCSFKRVCKPSRLSDKYNMAE